MPKTASCLVIFGAFGDLAQRKLFPSLYYLQQNKLLDDDFQIIALARRDENDASFQALVSQSLQGYIPKGIHEAKVEAQLLKRIAFIKLNFLEEAEYPVLHATLKAQIASGVIYYFATAATLYAPVCDLLSRSGCLDKNSRVVVEKPIGYNLKSSRVINDALANHFKENQIFRIDHYLGKETVQNLLALRFANSLFESQWHHKHISHVEITVAETVGIEGRWDYFDRAGQMRDMMQSHLLQLLCLIAMDPPNDLSADTIRDEKVKVLKALAFFPEDKFEPFIVRGQYQAGVVENQKVPAYLDESGAVANSTTGTFISVKAEIQNWRWQGVPFYLRTGKRLPEKITQIVVHFKPTAHFIFDADQQQSASNKLIIRIQPDEGISLQIMSKDSGLEKGMRLKQSPLDISFYQVGQHIPDAYERLLWEVIKGEQSMFVRRDEVEAAWVWCDHLMNLLARSDGVPIPYPSGSWGPFESSELMARDGRAWHE